MAGYRKSSPDPSLTLGLPWSLTVFSFSGLGFLVFMGPQAPRIGVGGVRGPISAYPRSMRPPDTAHADPAPKRLKMATNPKMRQ